MELIMEPGDKADHLYSSLKSFVFKALDNVIAKQVLLSLSEKFTKDTFIIGLREQDFEQVVFLKLPDASSNVHVICEIITNPGSAPSIELMNAICSACSSKYITLDLRPKIFISFRFDVKDDVISALKRSRLNNYISYYTCQQSLDNSNAWIDADLDYWKAG
jgi:hypothetical protein